MIPGRLALPLYSGDSYRWRFILWSDLDKTLPVDLSDAIAVAQIKDAPGGMLIVSMACTITLPQTIDVVLSATDSAKVLSTGAWDLRVLYGSGDITTIIAGPVSMVSDVTSTTVAMPFPAPSVPAPVVRPLQRRVRR